MVDIHNLYPSVDKIRTSLIDELLNEITLLKVRAECNDLLMREAANGEIDFKTNENGGLTFCKKKKA